VDGIQEEPVAVAPARGRRRPPPAALIPVAGRRAARQLGGSEPGRVRDGRHPRRVGLPGAAPAAVLGPAGLVGLVGLVGLPRQGGPARPAPRSAGALRAAHPGRGRLRSPGRGWRVARPGRARWRPGPRWVPGSKRPDQMAWWRRVRRPREPRVPGGGRRGGATPADPPYGGRDRPAAPRCSMSGS
jgi:hypothetical protein